MSLTYDPIATTTLGSAASTITFSSIPNTYTDLRIVWNGQWNTAADRLILRFNSDSGTNYSRTALYGQGTSAGSQASTSSSSIIALSSSRSQNLISMTTFDIFSYAGSTNKIVLYATAFDENGSGYVENGVGLWRNTSAITSLTLTTLNGNNFATNTIATLYGIKAA